MFKYIIKKLGMCFFTMFMISVFLFIMLNLIPADPVLSKLGSERILENPRLAEQMYKEFELDKPPFQRYIEWTKRVFLKFDFGNSFTYDDINVNDLIKSRLRYTLILSLLSFILTILIGTIFGILVAKYDKKTLGKFLNVFTQLGLAIPNFWLAILILGYFGVKLKLAPIRVSIDGSLFKILYSFTLPALTMVVGMSAVVSRYLKVSLIDEKNKYYIMVAKSKGLNENEIMIKHIFKNSLIPIITVMGLIVISTLTGSIVVENVFSIPGIGSLLINSIKNSDFPVIQAVVFYYSFVVVVVSFVLDIIYMIIDPRIRS